MYKTWLQYLSGEGLFIIALTVLAPAYGQLYILAGSPTPKYRLNFTIILSVLFSGTVHAASQLETCFDKAKEGRPSFDRCIEQVDLSRIDLAEETPLILRVLNRSDAWLARRAAGVPGAVLMLRPDEKTKRDARVARASVNRTL